MSRGNGRMRIFLDDTDYRKFLYVLGDVVDTFGVECWDFCVMPTHYHLALCPREPNLSKAIHKLNSVYAIWWNATHSTVGHVFQGRFKDQIVQREGYLEALCRYIARNPVRARLVDDPAKWPWSSYGSTAGLRPNPGFLFSEQILKQFGNDDIAVQQSLYRQHVLRLPSAEDHLDERFRSKERVLGDRAFKLGILGDWRARTTEPKLAKADTAASPQSELHQGA